MFHLGVCVNIYGLPIYSHLGADLLFHVGVLSGFTGAHGSSKLVPARAFIKLQVRLHARLTPATTYLTVDFQGVKPSE